MRGKADNRVVRQLPYSFRLTKQKFKAQRKQMQKRGPDSGPFFCSPLFQHSLGNAQHGANLGGRKTAQKAGLNICPKSCFFLQAIWTNKWLQGAHLRQVPLKPCGHEPIVSQKGIPSLSNAAHPLSSLPPYLSFPPMMPSNQCDHQNHQGLVKIVGLRFAPIANVRPQTRQTSIYCIWFE